jgi:phosphoglycerol transferase MdoB-like AlkP superfamily enzyme
MLYNGKSLNMSSPFGYVKLFFLGLRFDFSAIAVCNSLYILLYLLPLPFTANATYQKLLRIWFFITNGFFILLNIADTPYFPFIGKRMQFDAFDFLNGNKGDEFYKLLPTFLKQYWLLVVIYGMLIWVLVKFYKKLPVDVKKQKGSIKTYAIAFGAFAISAGIAIIGIRGGFQMKPLSLIHASQMTEVQNTPFILNTPFSIYNTVKKQRLKELNYFSEQEIDSCFTGIHMANSKDSFSKKNVVVIIVESLSREFVGYFGGKVKTPFIDSLLEQSLVFENGFANAKESIQGIPAVVSSTPSWQNDPFIFSPYSSNKIQSLANLLKPFGYSSTFYHGASKGSMGFDSYSALAGFDEYLGREDYNNEKDYDGHWGIWDEEFLKFAAQKMSAAKAPFFSTIFTLSSHHPFAIPEKYKNVFKPKAEPILACIEYTDFALRGFFNEIKNTEWFKNTVFVITADHTAHSASEAAANPMYNFAIPIAFFAGDGSLKGKNTAIANQIDIMPTVLSYINYPKPYFAFGKNLLDSSCAKFSINYMQGVYQYYDAEYCLQFNGVQNVGLFNWQKDSLFKNNLVNNPALAATLKERENSLKKAIQVFNNGMVRNKLIFE